MINRLLVRDTDSRRRNLHIRTFSVMPLNENNGLVQWVDNTSVLRTILNDLYTRNYGPELTKTSKIGELYNSMLRPKGKLTTLEVGRRLTMDDGPCMIACGSPICACSEVRNRNASSGNDSPHPPILPSSCSRQCSSLVSRQSSTSGSLKLSALRASGSRREIPTPAPWLSTAWLGTSSAWVTGEDAWPSRAPWLPFDHLCGCSTYCKKFMTRRSNDPPGTRKIFYLMPRRATASTSILPASSTRVRRSLCQRGCHSA